MKQGPPERSCSSRPHTSHRVLIQSTETSPLLQASVPQTVLHRTWVPWDDLWKQFCAEIWSCKPSKMQPIGRDSEHIHKGAAHWWRLGMHPSKLWEALLWRCLTLWLPQHSPHSSEHLFTSVTEALLILVAKGLQPGLTSVIPTLSMDHYETKTCL